MIYLLSTTSTAVTDPRSDKVTDRQNWRGNSYRDSNWAFNMLLEALRLDQTIIDMSGRPHVVVLSIWITTTMHCPVNHYEWVLRAIPFSASGRSRLAFRGGGRQSLKSRKTVLEENWRQLKKLGQIFCFHPPPSLPWIRHCSERRVAVILLHVTPAQVQWSANWKKTIPGHTMTRLWRLKGCCGRQRHFRRHAQLMRCCRHAADEYFDDWWLCSGELQVAKASSFQLNGPQNVWCVQTWVSVQHSLKLGRFGLFKIVLWLLRLRQFL